jgi:hypothetical protein
VTVNDRVFMLVTPVKSLFHSSLVHDVVTSGRKFAVDMNTGELTILPVSRESSLTIMLYLYNDPDSYVPLDKAPKELSKDFETALVQIEERMKYYKVKFGLIKFIGKDGGIFESISVNSIRWKRRLAEQYNKIQGVT